MTQQTTVFRDNDTTLNCASTLPQQEYFPWLHIGTTLRIKKILQRITSAKESGLMNTVE